jgi:hypothetical protein
VLVGLVAESAREFGCQFGFAVMHEIEQLFLAEYAPGAKPVGFVYSELASEAVAPAEVGEV